MLLCSILKNPIIVSAGRCTKWHHLIKAYSFSLDEEYLKLLNILSFNYCESLSSFESRKGTHLALGCPRRIAAVLCCVWGLAPSHSRPGQSSPCEHILDSLLRALGSRGSCLWLPLVLSKDGGLMETFTKNMSRGMKPLKKYNSHASGWVPWLTWQPFILNEYLIRECKN